MNNFITIFLTDGGLHREGESLTDREQYLQRFLYEVNFISKKSKIFFAFIKTQKNRTVTLCKQNGIQTIELLDINNVNNSFEEFTSIINLMR